MSIKARLLLAEQKSKISNFKAPPLLIITDPLGQAEEIKEYNRRWPVIGLTITVLKAKNYDRIVDQNHQA